MIDEVSIADRLRIKLAANESERLDSFAEALLGAAINKNTTAMKLVVELVEPTKPKEAEPRTMTDEELLEGLARFVERTGAHKALAQDRV